MSTATSLQSKLSLATPIMQAPMAGASNAVLSPKPVGLGC